MSAIASAASGILRRPWLDWLMPPRCGGCRQLGGWLCARCRQRVRRLEEPLCPRCGREVEFSTDGCGCRERLRALKRARAAAAYEGPLESAIHRFKYEGWKSLAPALASLLADRLAVEGLPAALLLAVPLHERRLRSRGYNQSELLARDLRRRFGLPGRPGPLVRLRDTPPQVGLDRRGRQANMAGAFAWQGPALAGRPVILVDDVATTCATLEACAAALRAAGSGAVHGFTVARVSI
jgi:ComF family protein